MKKRTVPIFTPFRSAQVAALHAVLLGLLMAGPAFAGEPLSITVQKATIDDSETIPLLRPAIYLSMILNFIGGFRVYAIIWILTRGGPVHASEVLTTYMYYQSFSHWGPSDMSYGATIAVALTFIVLIFAAIRVRFLSREGS